MVQTHITPRRTNVQQRATMYNNVQHRTTTCNNERTFYNNVRTIDVGGPRPHRRDAGAGEGG